MNLCFEEGYEAGLAELLVVLGTDDESASGLAKGAWRWCHIHTCSFQLEPSQGTECQAKSLQNQRRCA